MKSYLNSKWFAFFCACFNFYFAMQSFIIGDWTMFIVCSLFAMFCSYSFWHKMEEE
jgi:hypothetical protein